ncbi:hypothetical protein BOTBODRAFT_119640 [Botryobasidium botryosum FD-172 SS1]|uniref:18S rRNA factor 2 n=1 Tax=Botryobasidium botryosum (strain FD-172 SS1) TaxID=930990 RepID=A0A067LWM1_BOTB1|nr:hypothetical protein BOTBODRAFT_119640 [Botryobasidium botryosum FD-172 SS1]
MPGTRDPELETPLELEEDDAADEAVGGHSGGDDDDEGNDYPDPANEKTVKPLTAEALAAFRQAQERAGIIYISRIPPGMRPPKVRHLMSAYGEVGRVYLKQEDPKRAYLRRKHTSTRKVHFTEGWVEFLSKKVARSVADMLNARPIGGKKGTRWRDDVWTMKYLPKFKWNMLTEQVAHENATRTARLRVELSQSKSEQHDYLRNVELAKVLEKRAEKKRKRAEEGGEVEHAADSESSSLPKPAISSKENKGKGKRPKQEVEGNSSGTQREEALGQVLGKIF